MNKNQVEFPISIYGSIERYNDTLSKARCRIFYKGGNRNGTFITDEFANELISTLHYVPVKGIYEGNDFTDHGTVRSEGRVYGIVPETNNFAWEQHLDEDGIERTYACTDVYLFTALYPEASEAIGKGQSMELYEPSLTYHFSMLNGQKYVVFEHGSFLGLQVLGDDVEPCFEGASFFSLQQSIEDTIQKIKQYSTGGKSEMNINFKHSDEQKFSAIWALLNPQSEEASDYTCAYSVCEVFENYALAYNLEANCYEKVYFTESEEGLALGEKEQVFVSAMNETEKTAAEETAAQNEANRVELNSKIEEANTKIEEYENTIATLNMEAENSKAAYAALETQNADAQSQISALMEENESLKTYKKGIEFQSKEAVVAEYAGKLAEDVLDAYKTKFDEYSAEELDMHLAYELKKSNASVFSQTPAVGYIPKAEAPLSGVEEFLSHYRQ